MLAPDDPRHGTLSGRSGGCSGPTGCAACRAADTRYNKLRIRERDLGLVRRVSAVGFRRRIQALRALGYDSAWIASELGWSPGTLGTKMVRAKFVHPTTLARVVAVYDRLSMIPGPSSRARSYAAARGWPPPLAWDDETIDDPAAVPAHDVRPSERTDRRIYVDEVELLVDLGRDRLAGQLGVSVSGLQLALERAGRRDLWVRLCRVEDTMVAA